MVSLKASFPLGGEGNKIRVEQMNIARGYEPVTKLDTNVMTSRSMLASLNFPDWEIDKLKIW